MPRVIVGVDSPPHPAEALVRRLADELRSPGDGPLPFILERHIPVTKSRHVWVIWDRWGELEPEERSTVIGRAYVEAEGLEAAENLSIASGVRPEEAAVFGLVPFIVEPVVPSFLERDDYRQAKAREAQNTVMGEAARQLRYPTEDEARRALDRLKQSDPGTEWAIHRDEDEE